MSKRPKSEPMAEYVGLRDKIAAGRKIIADLEAQAAKPIGEIVKGYGPGPHKLTEGTNPDGSPRVLMLHFRAVKGGTFLVKEQDVTEFLKGE